MSHSESILLRYPTHRTASSLSGSIDRLLFNGEEREETEQRFLVSSASVQIPTSPLSWLAEEDRIYQAIRTSCFTTPEGAKAPPSVMTGRWLYS
ncbi:hypothetical protein CgunFtcFv8_009286 [Champsocephalus gunnari]|uniref:Uncharacterized protein n=1 Tax=Champsocephalus gunnari TaxID=52237 RepID=A0AAN8C1V0_CHAGU|nr:hypothetical protein CgunFtcFv8_009286 [Champsocephalus gunnari]